MTSPTKWSRLCPGEYTNSACWWISRVEQHAHYGGGFAWVLIDPNGISDFDPFDTLAEAKEAFETNVGETL